MPPTLAGVPYDHPCRVLVPLRSPGRGKTRLAAVLAPDQRAALAAAMLADVLAAVGDLPGAEPVVLAGGPAAVDAARALGVDALADPPGARGIDAAVAAAEVRLGPAACVLVLAADLPRVTSDELHTLVATAAPVVLAPTRDGGTGALLRRPGAVIATAYGPGSAARHLALATGAGVGAEVVHRPGLAADVDHPTDLVTIDPVSGRPVGPATARVLDELARVLLPRG